VSPSKFRRLAGLDAAPAQMEELVAVASGK
jgi:hypothetical protein